MSERTIYRDVRDLMASRVPIEGEAGVGYALRQGFDLPPLMFDEHEIEALVLGARIIESWTDAKLAEAAGNVIAKVEAVIPERLRQHMADTALLAPARHSAEPIAVDASELRRALRRRFKVHFCYRDGEDRASARTVRPLALSFYGPVLVCRRVVRTAPGLPLVPAGPHLRARRAGRAIPRPSAARHSRITSSATTTDRAPLLRLEDVSEPCSTETVAMDLGPDRLRSDNESLSFHHAAFRRRLRSGRVTDSAILLARACAVLPRAPGGASSAFRAVSGPSGRRIHELHEGAVGRRGGARRLGGERLRWRMRPRSMARPRGWAMASPRSTRSWTAPARRR